MSEPVACYDYCDARGRLAFRVLRYHPKRFETRGAAGELLTARAPRAILYRLPELLAAPAGATVFVVEGEQDVETLLRARRGPRDFVATTAPGGCPPKGEPWRAEYSQFFAGRHVVVLPDRDRPGRRHAADIVESLQPVARSVVAVDLPRLRPPQDVTDWFTTRNGTLEELDRLVRVARLTLTGGPPAPREKDRREIIFRAEIPAAEKLLLLALQHHPGDGRTGEVALTAGELAGMVGAHRTSVQRALQALRRQGILEPGSGRSTHRVRWDLLAAMQASAAASLPARLRAAAEKRPGAAGTHGRRRRP